MAMREFLYDTKPLPEEPDDLVVINPTRVNEPDGAILVYRKEGVLVFDGKQIPIGKIVEGYVSNSRTPSLRYTRMAPSGSLGRVGLMTTRSSGSSGRGLVS